MIYIYTEDSKDGKVLCDIISQQYFNNVFNDVKIDTLSGIWGLKSKLEGISNTINSDDIVIIVYDNLRENPIIDTEINEASEYIDEKGLYEQFMWIPTKSFELEILLIIGIELFMNRENYKTYFWELREKYIETGEISDLTIMSKQNHVYDELYSNARNEKKKRRLYQKLSCDDFENAITIETISKDIMKEMFRNVYIDKPMGECWKKNCCYRHRRCTNECIDFDTLTKKQQDEDLYKTKFIIMNTSYSKLISVVYKLHGEEIDLPQIYITDFVDDYILRANHIMTLLNNINPKNRSK